MIEAIYFSNEVKKAFLFLEEQYNFQYVGFKDEPRLIIVKYKKNELIITIEYSRANNYIEVNIYNHVSVVNPGEYSWKYNLSIGFLIKKYEGEFIDFNTIKDFSLEEKIEFNSFYLKKYGDTILSEKEWFSWGDIADYKQYVPPDLP